MGQSSLLLCSIEGGDWSTLIGRRSAARSVSIGWGAGTSLWSLTIVCCVFHLALVEFILAILLFQLSSLVEESWLWNGSKDQRIGIDRFWGTPGKFGICKLTGRAVGPVKRGGRDGMGTELVDGESWLGTEVGGCWLFVVVVEVGDSWWKASGW